jgi:uncharacterized membrane protein
MNTEADPKKVWFRQVSLYLIVIFLFLFLSLAYIFNYMSSLRATRTRRNNLAVFNNPINVVV